MNHAILQAHNSHIQALIEYIHQENFVTLENIFLTWYFMFDLEVILPHFISFSG
jgi:hypothetical protein